MKNIITVLILCQILVVISGCEYINKVKGSIYSTKTTFFIAADNSNSFKITMKDKLNVAVEEVLKIMSEGDVIIIMPIDMGSLTKSEIIAEYKMPDNLGPSGIFKNSEIDNFKKQYAEVFDKLEKRGGNLKEGTSITGLMKSVADLCKYNSEMKCKLIIISDGIEESDKYNFNKEKDIIKAKERINEYPDLKECEVYFCGINASDENNFNMLKDFWECYTDRSNGKFKAFNFDVNLALNN